MKMETKYKQCRAKSPRGSWGQGSTRAAGMLVSALGLLGGGCAGDCFDDGLGQTEGDACPSAASGSSSGEASAGATSGSSAGLTTLETTLGTDSNSAGSTSDGPTASSGASSETGGGSSEAGSDTGNGNTGSTDTGADPCENGVHDGDESDVDCGGSCDPCDDGEMCVGGDDCISTFCADDSTCTTPTCDDGVENGTETDVDCGGPACEACVCFNAGALERVSVGTGGVEGDGGSPYADVSDDGQLVAFLSSSTNIVPNDTNNISDLFLLDRSTDTVVRLNLGPGEIEANGGGHGWPIFISGDGERVLFDSTANNLVADDINGARDLFVVNTQTGLVERVNVSGAGVEDSSGVAGGPVPKMSDNGRYVPFFSAGTTLVPDDTPGIDLYLRDLDMGTTVRVVEGITATSGYAAASDEGDVAYASGGFADSAVYLFDADTMTSTRVDVNADGEPADARSRFVTISSDGMSVAFVSEAANLVEGDTNAAADVFVHSVDDGLLVRVSIASDGGEGDGAVVAGFVEAPELSWDGRLVAFTSVATNMVSDDTNSARDVFVHDRHFGTTTRVSEAADGTEGNGGSNYPAFSPNGQFLCWRSGASNLVADDTNDRIDTFMATSVCEE